MSEGQEIIDAAMGAFRSFVASATADSTREDGSVDLDAFIARLNTTTDALQGLAQRIKDQAGHIA